MLAFIIGGIAGAAFAMLYTPETGENVRRRINELKDDIYDKKDDYADEAKERFADAVDKGKDFIEEQKDVISSAIEAGKGAYKKEKSKTTEADA
jgi:gas vesicle protein